MRTSGSILCLAVAIVASSLLPAPPVAADLTVVDHRVTFEVTNTNTSAVACPSDGRDYTVRGHLVGPTGAIHAATGGTVDLYVHGVGLSEATWTFDAVSGYRHVDEMAKLGRVSVTVERLGWDPARYPHGFVTCIGSAADVVHQIVGKLRTGDYAVEGSGPLRFSRVVLAGHDIGGGVAQLEAYSYADVDGLVVMGYHNQGVGDEALGEFVDAGGRCAAGGEAPDSSAPLGGYVWFSSDEAVRENFVQDAEPDVADAIVSLREKAPCGELMSTPAEVLTGARRLADIAVPVLLVFADHDVGFTPEGSADQAGHYSGSDDVTSVMLENAAHFFMFERGAPHFRAVLSSWLDQRFAD